MPMKNPNHTGDFIRDCLDELGVNVTDGAKALGVTRSSLPHLLNRRAGVSAEMALRLEQAIGSTAGFWLRLQLNHDLAQIHSRSSKIHFRRLGTPPQLAYSPLLPRQRLLIKVGHGLVQVFQTALLGVEHVAGVAILQAHVAG